MAMDDPSRGSASASSLLLRPQCPGTQTTVPSSLRALRQLPTNLELILQMLNTFVAAWLSEKMAIVLVIVLYNVLWQLLLHETLLHFARR